MVGESPTLRKYVRYFAINSDLLFDLDAAVTGDLMHS